MIAKCKLHDIGLGNVHEFHEFSEPMNRTPKAQATRTKINKCNYIKVKNFCTAKKTIRVKR